MKTHLSWIAIIILLLTSVAAFAKPSIRVFVDSQRSKLDPPPMMKDGRIYLGLRGVATALGACAKWDEKTKTAMVTLGNKRVRIEQSQGVTVNGVLYLPLRKMGEAVGCTVHWDPDAHAVRITKEGPCPVGGG